MGVLATLYDKLINSFGRKPYLFDGARTTETTATRYHFTMNDSSGVMEERSCHWLFVCRELFAKRLDLTRPVQIVRFVIIEESNREA